MPASHLVVIKLHARHVTFDYNRFLVEADGNVDVRTSDGMELRGDAFSMDLKLNRFVLAGHVTAQSSAGIQHGAALADFLDFDRIYFDPIVAGASGTPLPDRWTFIDGDFAHPLKGRVMPGDTFALPDVAGVLPFVEGTSVTIGARNYLRFGHDSMKLVGSVYVPLPSFYLNFSTNEHLADNSLSGANLDATYEFSGNANSIEAAHARYDVSEGAYLSYEQHLSGSKGYAVFSLNPATQPSKFLNVVLSDKPSNRLQFRSFTQFHEVGSLFHQPSEAGIGNTLQAVYAFPRSFVQAVYQNVNYSLLAPGAATYFAPHPSSVQVSDQTFDAKVGKTPLLVHWIYGFGMQNNVFGLETLGGVQYNTIWQHNVGMALTLPQFKIGHSPLDFQNYYINASYTRNFQWNSLPHQIDIADTQISLSRVFRSHWSSFLQYDVNNVRDIYGTNQLAIYPGSTPSGATNPAYGSFHGYATFRTLALDVNYTNSDNFVFNLIARKHDDFPKPVPFFYPAPQYNVLGQELQPYYLGQPPYDVTADVRFRINPHLSLDIARTYYFNYSGMRWSPHFYFQVGQ